MTHRRYLIVLLLQATAGVLLVKNDQGTREFIRTVNHTQKSSKNPYLPFADLKNTDPYVAPAAEQDFITKWLNITAYIKQHFPTEIPSDIFLTTPELIHKHGYPNETHYILTDDGYVLTYHRIRHGKQPPPPGTRPIPVLLQHGIFSESTHWLTQPEFNCLPYILADAGYDVWLGNGRGNRYSRNHIRYTTHDWQFWHTEWHQMGIFDITAGINYILRRTGYKKMNYIGHSMGTTMFFVMLSMFPEYNDKINYMVALSPPIFMSHTVSPVKSLAPLLGWGGMQDLVVKAGKGEFFPHDIFSFLEHIYGPICTPELFAVECAAAYFAIVGFDYQLLNMTHLPVMMASFPSSTPTPGMIHFFQEMNCPRPCFQQIDGGPTQNMLNYGTPRPPSYDFSLMRVPKTFFFGLNDILVDYVDVQFTRGLIPNTNYTLMPHPEWNHMDFLWAKNAYEVLHPQVVCLLKEHDYGFW